MSREHTVLLPGSWTRRIAAVAITGALALGGMATVAAASGPGAGGVEPPVVPQELPDESRVPAETPVVPPDDAGEQAQQAENASDNAIEGAGRPDEPGRPDGVGAAGNGNVPELPELPEDASDQARSALDAVADLHEQIAERIDAVRDMPAGPERGEAVSEIAKEFGEQFRALAEALADDEE